jgi:iron transport multicopper oxidase
MESTGEDQSELRDLNLRSIRAIINNVTYVTPVLPTLYTAMSAPEDVVMNPLIYGANTNPFVLKYNDIVEVVLTNNDNGAHPWQ